jgi:hypothetical protein
MCSERRENFFSLECFDFVCFSIKDLLGGANRWERQSAADVRGPDGPPQHFSLTIEAKKFRVGLRPAWIGMPQSSID